MADIDRSAPTPPDAAAEAASAGPRAPAPADVASFFAGVPLGVEVFLVAVAALAALGRCEVRVTRSQVAFRRRRGFAWLWRPGRWLRNPAADVVLSFALREPIKSARLKQVVRASPRTWMHHLEVRDAAELDAEVLGWLRQAFEEAE